MPNYCENHITISGDKSKFIDKLVKEFRNEDGSPFGHVIPPNDNDTALDRTETWGCKWEPDVYDVNYEEKDDQFYLYVACQTPWSPPTGILNKLFQMGYIVSCQYIEFGNSFVGEFDNGNDYHGNICWKDDDEMEQYYDGDIELSIDDFIDRAKFNGTWYVTNPKTKEIMDGLMDEIMELHLSRNPSQTVSCT